MKMSTSTKVQKTWKTFEKTQKFESLLSVAKKSEFFQKIQENFSFHIRNCSTETKVPKTSKTFEKTQKFESFLSIEQKIRIFSKNIGKFRFHI